MIQCVSWLRGSGQRLVYLVYLVYRVYLVGLI
jgi:hypothetical protein